MGNACPCGLSLDTVGGLYTDAKHFKGSGLAGTRMVADGPGEKLTVVGTDDGAAFWAVAGRVTDKAEGSLVLDFSPKGGPADLAGKYSLEYEKILWSDGNAWVPALSVPTTQGKQSGARGDVGGLYFDAKHFSSTGSVKGLRFVAAAGDTVTLVGSDDGIQFWGLTGSFTDKASGIISVDFTPKGGPAGLSGTFNGDKIEWKDGNSWQRA
mmetsp:Transcript_26366/g.83499  ORF Transcript_26366/g.83499 Transcript_26366/m.83499 type:complete len:210 (-) Transcript_26366:54-683(-)